VLNTRSPAALRKLLKRTMQCNRVDVSFDGSSDVLPQMYYRIWRNPMHGSIRNDLHEHGEIRQPVPRRNDWLAGQAD
jgi:hypothetical protein